MTNYIVIALYDQGYGGFNWSTDIPSMDNEKTAFRICSMIDMMDYSLRRENNRDKRQRITQEVVSELASLYPMLRQVIWVSNDDIRIVIVEV